MDKIYTIEELETKLAQAVEAIDRALWDMDIGYDISAFHILKTSLAELKGQDADALAALERVKREARNEALREAANTARRCKDMPPEDAILALVEDTDDE